MKRFEKIWPGALVLFAAAAILLPVAMGEGKVDKLMGGVYRENDVDSTSVPVQAVQAGANIAIATNATTLTITGDAQTDYYLLMGDQIGTTTGTAHSARAGSGWLGLNSDQNPAADGDAREVLMYMPVGVYKLTLSTVKNYNRGRGDWYWNNVLVKSQVDYYAGSAAYTLYTNLVTNTVAGYQEFTHVVNGKSGSSSGYFFVICGIWLDKQ